MIDDRQYQALKFRRPDLLQASNAELFGGMYIGVEV